jgi:2-succinyl-5-enolpyruvyl-6-hydroxy-3-cyclohexene-1-carboxylate synthase
MLKELKRPMVIVVLNNNGGGIFSFLPIQKANAHFERYFGTPHHLTFHAACDLFGLNYARTDMPDDFARTYRIALESRTSTVIEIPTERTENLKIHQQLQSRVRTVVDTFLNTNHTRTHYDKKHDFPRKTVNLGQVRKLRRYQIR